MSLVAQRLPVAFAIAIVTAALTGCSSQPEQPGVTPLAQIAAEAESAPAQNGIDALSPADALTRAIDTMEATGSYRVSGTTSSGSAIDISFRVGVGSVGTITAGTPVTLASTGGAVYVTGDPESIAAQVGADVNSTIAGKWLTISPDSTSGFAIFADGKTFAQSVLGAQGPGEITGVTDVDGLPAVGLLFPETGGTLWVAATGDPLPLRFEEKGASAGSGVLKFTDFGADVAVPELAPDDIVDVTKVPAG